jgi:hypothetical protein
MHKKEIRELICAMMLGDGYFQLGNNPKHTVGALWCEHSMSQFDYVKWKAQQIDVIFQKKNIDRSCRIYTRDRLDKRTQKTYHSCTLMLSWRNYISFLHPKIYRNGRKNYDFLLSQVSTDKHLAIWLMDDGSESKTKKKHVDGIVYYGNPYFRLSAYDFTPGEVNLAKQWFKQYYQIEPVANQYKHGPILQFTVAQTKSLFPRIRPYVSQTESMRKKFSLCLERY